MRHKLRQSPGEMKTVTKPLDPKSFYQRSSQKCETQSSKSRSALSDKTNCTNTEENTAPLKTPEHVTTNTYPKKNSNVSSELDLPAGCHPHLLKKMPVDDSAVLKIPISHHISAVNSHSKKRKRKSQYIIPEPLFDKMVEEYHSALKNAAVNDSSVANSAEASGAEKPENVKELPKSGNFLKELQPCVVRLERTPLEDLKSSVISTDMVINDPVLLADKQLPEPRNKKPAADLELFNSLTKRKSRKLTPQSKKDKSENSFSQKGHILFSTPEPDLHADQNLLKTPGTEPLHRISTRAKSLFKTPVSDPGPVKSSVKRKHTPQSVKDENENIASRKKRAIHFSTPDSDCCPSHDELADSSFSFNGSRSSSPLKHPKSSPSISVTGKYAACIPEIRKKSARQLRYLGTIREESAESDPHCDLYEFKADEDDPEYKKRKIKPKPKKKEVDESFVLHGDLHMPKRSPICKILRSYKNSHKENLSEQVTAAVSVSVSPKETDKITETCANGFSSVKGSSNDSFYHGSSFNIGNRSIKDSSISNKENVLSVSGNRRRSKRSSVRNKNSLESNKENIDDGSQHLSLSVDSSSTQNQENSLTSFLGSSQLENRHDVSSASFISEEGHKNAVNVNWSLDSGKFAEDFSTFVQNLSSPPTGDGVMEKSQVDKNGTAVDYSAQNCFGFDEEPEVDNLCSSKNFPVSKSSRIPLGFSSTPHIKQKPPIAHPTRLPIKPSFSRNRKGTLQLQLQDEPSKMLDQAHPRERSPILLSVSEVDALKKELDLLKIEVKKLESVSIENMPAMTDINKRLDVVKKRVSEIKRVLQNDTNAQKSSGCNVSGNLSGQSGIFTEDSVLDLDHASDLNSNGNDSAHGSHLNMSSCAPELPTMISEEVQTELSFPTLSDVQETEIKVSVPTAIETEGTEVEGEHDSSPVNPASGSSSPVESSSESPLSFVSTEPVSTSPHLFNDVVLPVRSPKTPRRSYTGRRKTERFCEPTHSFDESNDEELHKPKTKKSKKEEKEMEKEFQKWAQQFNAQCEDIEHFDLCVE